MKKFFVFVAAVILLLVLIDWAWDAVDFDDRPLARTENQTSSTTTTIIPSTTITEPPEKSLAFLFSATELEQGDTLIVEAQNVPAEAMLMGEFGDRAFDFFHLENGKQIAVVGIDAKKPAGTYRLSVATEGMQKEKTITVKKKDFYITKIAIAPELEEQGYTPAGISNTISTEDGVVIYEVLGEYHPAAYFNRAFVYPLDEIINVGAFGNIRQEGGVTIQHLGVDLDAVEGTPVYAVNDGKVVLTVPLTVYGNTMIIDHGLGIYSLYLHLSEFKAGLGDMVQRGEIIGLSGNTGWSNGPHLHLSIKANGASVDPLLFIKETNKFLP